MTMNEPSNVNGQDVFKKQLSLIYFYFLFHRAINSQKKIRFEKTFFKKIYIYFLDQKGLTFF